MKYADLELEKAVLGCMVVDNSIILNVANFLQDDDFTQETNRKIYRAIIGLNAEKRAADIVALGVMNLGNPGYIATLSDVVPSGVNWDFYAKKVKNLSLCRQFSGILQEGIDTSERDVLEKINNTARRMLSLADRSGASTKVKTLKEVMPRICDRLTEATKHKGELWGIDTGFQNLNEYLCGFQAEYIIIGARPSIGKSAFGMNMAVNMAKKKHKGVYFQLEMTDEAMTFRAISSESGINMKMIKGGFIDSGKPLQKVMGAMETLADLPLAIEDGMSDIHDIAARIRYLVRCEGYEWAMIDHLSIVRTRNNRVPRNEQHIEISGIIRDLRKELRIPIICLAQLGRGTEGKPPSLADLRETGSYEQDADTVMFLHRDRAEDMNVTAIPTDLIISKQRDGACGTVKLIFMPQIVAFKDAAREGQNESR